MILPQYLIVLKLFTLAQRGRTGKGRKDFLDLISLYLSLKDRPFTLAAKLARAYQLDSSLKYFAQILSENTNIPELTQNTHQYGVLKKSLTAIFV